jgi:hypothetical protein
MAKPVGQQLAARVLAARSPLYRWLFENHAEIAAVLATQPRPGWQILAATAADAGVRTADGAAPSRHLVRKTWKQVERTMTQPSQPRLGPTSTTTPPVVAVHPPAAERQPVPRPSPVPPAEPSASPRKRRFDIKPATFKED